MADYAANAQYIPKLSSNIMHEARLTYLSFPTMVVGALPARLDRGYRNASWGPKHLTRGLT